MKKLLVPLLSILMILSGCSLITVDENTETEDTASTSASKNTPTPIEETQDKTEDSSIQNVIEDFFSFEWLSRKELDARPVEYLALGDSLTRGVGDETDHYGFTGILATELEKWPAISEVNLDNRGKNGRRSDQLLALLEKGHYDEQLEKADLVTITLGGNDVMKVVKSDLFNLDKKMFDEAMPGFLERYQEIVDYIRTKTDAPLVMVGFYNPFSIVTDETTPFETIIHEWNEQIEQMAEKTDTAVFVPVEDLFVSNTDMVYHTDLFHPNARGYERMAARVIDIMKTWDIESISNGLLGFEE